MSRPALAHTGSRNRSAKTRAASGSIEAVLAAHPAVAECAVIGVADEIKGQVPRGFVVLKAGATAERLADELIEAVRESIGAVACFRIVDVVPALPKTRSGKILRKTMRGIADGRDEAVPSTIEDPAVLDALRPSSALALDSRVRYRRIAHDYLTTKGSNE